MVGNGIELGNTTTDPEAHAQTAWISTRATYAAVMLVLS